MADWIKEYVISHYVNKRKKVKYTFADAQAREDIQNLSGQVTQEAEKLADEVRRATIKDAELTDYQVENARTIQDYAERTFLAADQTERAVNVVNAATNAAVQANREAVSHEGAAELARDKAQDYKNTAQQILAEIQNIWNSILGKYDEFQDDANNYVTMAESYAHGNTDSRAGENTDNAQYYSELARTQREAAEDAKEDAAASANLAQQAAEATGYMFFNINSAGHLIMTRTENVTGDINFELRNGRLYAIYGNI